MAIILLDLYQPQIAGYLYAIRLQEFADYIEADFRCGGTRFSIYSDRQVDLLMMYLFRL